MNSFLTKIRYSVGRLHRAQSGAALTEFAITLPVYLAFTVGILTLYNIQQDTLISQARASSSLWNEVIEAQTSYNPAHMVPIAGAAMSQVDYYNPIGDTFSVMSGLDTITAAGGIHFEGGTKAGTITAIPGFTLGVEPGARPILTPDIMDSNSHAFCLVNDNLVEGISDCDTSFSGFSSTINSLLDIAGVRPGFAAGIRYGVVGAYDDESYESHHLLNNDDPKARFNTMVPTVSEERIWSVLLTRLEMGRGGNYDSFVAFGIDAADFSGTDQIDTAEVTECQQNAQAAGEAYADCEDVEGPMDRSRLAPQPRRNPRHPHQRSRVSLS